MSVTLDSPPVALTETAEQRFVMRAISWDAYVTICDVLEEHMRCSDDLQRWEIDSCGKVSPS